MLRSCGSREFYLCGSQARLATESGAADPTQISLGVASALLWPLFGFDLIRLSALLLLLLLCSAPLSDSAIPGSLPVCALTSSRRSSPLLAVPLVMHRVPSLLSRHLSRQSERSSLHPHAAAHATTAAALPTLDHRSIRKLAVACQRSNFSHSSASSPIAAPTPQLAATPRHISTLLSPRVTPLTSPRVTPMHSRNQSFNFSTMAAAASAAAGRTSPVAASVAHVRRASPVGLVSRVIAPFTPMRFVTTRPSGSSGERDTRTREKEATTNAPLYGSRPATSQPPVEILHKGVPVGQVGAQQTTESAASHVIADAGLSDFLGQVYSTTGWSVVGSLAASYGLAMVLSPAMFMPAMIGGFVVSLGSIFALSSMKPQTVRKASSGPDSLKLVTHNSTARQGVYALFIGSNALTMVPLVAMCSALHPLIIPASAGIAGLVMAGSSLYAYRKPSGSLVSWQGPLMGALLAAIGVQLGAGVALWAMGPNLFSSLAFTVYPYFSIGLFSALTAVDTHTAIAEYQKGEAGLSRS